MSNDLPKGLISSKNKNKDGKQGYCKTCMKDINRYTGTEAQKSYTRNSGRRLRKEVLSHLSENSPKCETCSFSNVRGLQIDHIHGGGAEEFRTLSNQGIYRKILKLSPERAKQTYQILCANCNKRKEGPITNKNYKAFRIRVLKHIGDETLKCCRCDETDILVLCVDHIHGGGTKEFIKKGAYKVYREILSIPKHEVMEHFQILCRNCNRIKGGGSN